MEFDVNLLSIGFITLTTSIIFYIGAQVYDRQLEGMSSSRVYLNGFNYIIKHVLSIVVFLSLIEIFLINTEELSLFYNIIDKCLPLVYNNHLWLVYIILGVQTYIFLKIWSSYRSNKNKLNDKNEKRNKYRIFKFFHILHKKVIKSRPKSFKNSNFVNLLFELVTTLLSYNGATILLSYIVILTTMSAIDANKTIIYGSVLIIISLLFSIGVVTFNKRLKNEKESGISN